MNAFNPRSLVVGGCLLASLSSPLAAFAGTDSLQAEVAQSDNSTPAPVDAVANPAPTSRPPLQGGVSKLDELLKATESTDLYKLSVNKLTKGFQLSAEEYRSLGVGCIGFESDRRFFQDIAIVTAVYRGSPADLAGIKKGDKLIDPGNDEAAVEHPEIPRWKVTFGQAGSQATITVLRHHKPVQLTLTRMNIEDIADDDERHEWEQIVAKLGNPESGSFEGVGKYPPIDE
jgi:hypothetical protein